MIAGIRPSINPSNCLSPSSGPSILAICQEARTWCRIYRSVLSKYKRLQKRKIIDIVNSNENREFNVPFRSSYWSDLVHWNDCRLGIGHENEIVRLELPN